MVQAAVAALETQIVWVTHMKVPGVMWNEASAYLIAKAKAAYLSDQWHSVAQAA